MKKIRHISVAEYMQLAENEKSVYDLLIGSVTPGKVVMAKFIDRFVEVSPKQEDLWDLTYSDIIELKTALAELEEADLVMELARIVYGIHDITIVSVIDLQGFNWIIEAMAEMIETEKRELAYEPSEKEKAAGIDELERFGFMPTIDSLAAGNMSEYNQVLSQPYHKVFQKLCYQKTINSITKKLSHVG